MQFEHRFILPADRDHAWAVLCRPDLAASCYPGLSLGSLGGRDYLGTLKVKLGPHPMAYRGTVSMAERSDPRHRLRLVARGADQRGRGTVDLDLTVRLSRAGDGATEVQATVELNLTGRPTELGAEAVRLVGERLLAQFVDCLTARLPAIDPDAPARAAAVGDHVGAGPAGAGGATRLFTSDESDGPSSRRRAARSATATLVRHPGQVAAAAALLALTLGLVRRWRR